MVNVLDIRNVYFSYDGRTKVLNNITLAIPKGVIVGLIGPNGSGKSTLIKNVFDLLRLQSGSITIEGHIHTSTGARSGALYLSSNDYLPQFLTAREYIGALGKLFGVDVDEQSLHDLFQRFSMDGRYDDLIEDYSHGMRKKTQLVSGLLMRRPLTVIDETLNGIDIEALYLCEKEFRGLREDGLSILLCTHDFPLLERIADLIVFLDLGRVVTTGLTKELVAKHGSLVEMVFAHLDADTRRP